MNINVPTCDEKYDPDCIGGKSFGLSRVLSKMVSGERKVFNMQTAFLDGSQVYGYDNVRASLLRTFVGGKMKTSAGNLMPLITQSNQMAGSHPKRFLSGDVRANENPALQALHTLFVREHNRRAAILAKKNPTWNDEKIFQYTRRFIIALLQKITCNQVL